MADSIVGFALAVLLAAVALNLAAQLVQQALPVLIPLAVMAATLFAWRWWRDRQSGW